MGVVIGIDPGLGGAIAVLFDGQSLVVDTPTVYSSSSKKSRRQLMDTSACLEILRCAQLRAKAACAGISAFIERVHSMPGQGVSSSFKFGHGLGVWEGLLVGLEIPYTLVTPQRWKQSMLDGYGKDKNDSVLRAKALFPQLSQELNRSRSDGRAEALLIAQYGVLHLT